MRSNSGTKSLWEPHDGLRHGDDGVSGYFAPSDTLPSRERLGVGFGRLWPICVLAQDRHTDD
jgi:hypothetical protein